MDKLLDKADAMFLINLARRCSRQKILVMLSAIVAAMSGECLKCVKRTKS